MSTITGLEVFDRTIQASTIWIDEIMQEMGWTDRHKAYHALEAVFHALRDRLPVNVTANLSAQLPILIRGIFFEGWQPEKTPVRERTQDEFLTHVTEAFLFDVEVVPPFPKLEPDNLRESDRPAGPERTLYEEATRCGTDRGYVTSSGRGLGKRGEGPRGLQAVGDQRADVLSLANEVRRDGSADSKQIAQAVLKVLAKNVSHGQIEKVKAALPEGIRQLWM